MSNKNLTTQLTKTFLDFIKDNNITDYDEVSSLLRETFDKLASETLKIQDVEVQHISSSNAVVEVKDNENNQLYRRYLELEFEETSTGIRIKGESLDGKPSEIVFLSSQSIGRISELRGQGSDSPEHH